MTALCYNSGGREKKDGETGVGETSKRGKVVPTLQK